MNLISEFVFLGVAKMAEDFEFQLQSQHSFAQAPVSTETTSYTHTDPNDGTVYEWDGEKRGWFPKVIVVITISAA